MNGNSDSYSRGMMEKEEFLTAEEAAKRLQVHSNTIYAMVKLGRLKGYSIRRGRPIRRRLCFKRTDIEQLLERHRMGDPWARKTEDEFMTMKEAADLLLVHTSTIHLMVRRGCLKTYPVGKRLCFKREDVHALLGK